MARCPTIHKVSQYIPRADTDFFYLKIFFLTANILATSTPFRQSILSIHFVLFKTILPEEYNENSLPNIYLFCFLS